MAVAEESRKLPQFYFWVFIGSGAMYAFRLLLAWTLSPKEYGAFFALLGLVLFLLIFNDFGLGGSFLYNWEQWRQQSKRSSLFTLIFVSKIGLSLILSAIFFFARDFIADHYFHLPWLSPYLALFAIFFFIEAFEQFLSSLQAATGRMQAYASMNNIQRVLLIIASFIVVMFFSHENLFAGFILAWVGSAGITTLAYAWPLRSYTAFIRFPVRKDVFFGTWRYAGYLFLTSVSGLLLARIDVLFITYFRGAMEVGWYEVALPLATILLTFTTPLIIFLRPTIVKRHAAGASEDLKSGLRILYGAGVFFLLPIAFSLLIFPHEIIQVLFGSKYLVAAPAVAILGLAFFFKSFQMISNTFLYGMGMAKQQMYIIWFGAILNIILNYFFIPRFGFVAAAATTLTCFFLMLVVSTFVLHRKIKITLPIENWLKTFALAVVVMLLTMLLKRLLSTNLYVKAAILGSFFFATYYLIGIFLLRIVDSKRLFKLLMSLAGMFRKRTKR